MGLTGGLDGDKLYVDPGGLDGDKLHVDPGGLREDPEVFRV